MKNSKSIDKLSSLSAEIKRITRFFQEKNKRVPLCLRKDIIAFYLENGDISIETVSSNFNLIWNVLRLLGMNEDECIDYISKKYHICFCRSEELLLNLSMVYDIGLLKEVLLGYSNNLSSSFSITTERLYALILEYQKNNKPFNLCLGRYMDLGKI